MADSTTPNRETLRRLIDLRALRRLAGAVTFGRGEEYVALGRVHDLAESHEAIAASVHGTRPYDVRLWHDDGDLGHSCSCPVGEDGALCKHCVAVGIAWLEPGRSAATDKPEKPGATLEDARRYLSALDKDAVVDLVMTHASRDERLRQVLFMTMARTSPGGPDLDVYRSEIDSAIDNRGFVDYHEAGSYAQRIHDAIDSIETLLNAGFATEAIALAERALKRVEKSLGSVDDSNGEVSGTLTRLQDLHHAACATAMPNPEALAKRLFAWEMRSEWDTFRGAVERYAGVLGDQGLATYRRLAAAEWARVPALRPGSDDLDRYGARFRISSIMETLARHAGDVDALVDVLRRDLSMPYGFLRIAEVCKEAGRDVQAVDWAERGLKAFPDRPDSRLRRFLATEYQRDGRHDEAMTLAWAEFTERPELDRYRLLKDHADCAGQWPSWRERALASLRQAAGRPRRVADDKQPSAARPDHSVLVRVLLWEGNVDDAWREAMSARCSDDLWLELAARRGSDHPADAVPIYQRLVESTVARTNNNAYHEAMGLIRNVRDLLARLDRAAEFDEYVQSVRARFKLKRNLMKLLERARWT
jgi:uncharacterized Zn finger protein